MGRMACVLPDPQAIDLVVDAHPLALVAERAAAFQQLEKSSSR